MEFNEDAELHFDAIQGSEVVLPADTVILATDQEPDLSFLPKDIKVNRLRTVVAEVTMENLTLKRGVLV